MSVTFPFGLPQNQNFSQFIYYPNFLNPEEIDMVRGLWQRNEELEAKLSNGEEAYDDALRKTKLAFIEPQKENQWLYEKLGSLAIKCNQERYGFDILGFHYNLQLAKYGEGDFFNWHLDFGVGPISNRKLSISVQLSDPSEYEGGELQFMINDDIINAPKEKGTVIIFPSFIMHRVTPITKGTRQSIVAWIAGPPYR
ncbi:2OG-Fe(II) oxygenase [Roseivirga seohaensis]|uniref:2OG-Fe(II) oxygenase n=1 Tax=Roseivirga seohaensis TaxID=1914963 RepID=A0A150XKS4_9BACT|nr:2OG-Fe(II) oxygenase [Roseivirga seohaensis]KYG79222.1 2OG-Fe(II) oxygenase [Roseivirga seohaensis]